MGIFDKFKSGLGKSSSSLTDGFKNIFSKKKIDSTILEEFEELITVSYTHLTLPTNDLV